MKRQGYWVYIMSSRSRTLYIGVTGDIALRVQQHKSGVASAFTRQYLITRLVHLEEFASPADAIAREKQLKGWVRAKKIALIEETNRTWDDLSAGWELPTPGVADE